MVGAWGTCQDKIRCGPGRARPRSARRRPRPKAAFPGVTSTRGHSVMPWENPVRHYARCASIIDASALPAWNLKRPAPNRVHQESAMAYQPIAIVVWV